MEEKKEKMMEKEKMCEHSKCLTLAILVVGIILFIFGYVFGKYNMSEPYRDNAGIETVNQSTNNAIAIDRVNKAIELVNLVGREQAFEVLNSNFSIHEDWYVFIYNKSTGLEVVNPWSLTLGDVRDWIDLDGKPAGIEIYNASAEGNFVEYSFTAPVSGNDVNRSKRSFVKLYDGYIYGAGYYLKADYKSDYKKSY